MGRKTGNIFIVMGVMLVIAGGFLLMQKMHGYQAAGRVYENIQKTVVDGNQEEDPDTFNIDWEVFAGTDVIAWIRVGDKISYPVVQGKDNSYYLHRLYNGKKNYAGSIFLHSACEPDFTSRNSIIYGHNMRNGSMFGALKKYLKKTDDPYFYIYLPDGTMHTYQISSVARVSDGSRAYMYQFADMDTFLDYQKYMLKKSVWDAGVMPETRDDSKLVSLSTCASVGSKRGHRVMVQGFERDVCQVQEPASWYIPSGHGEDESGEEIESMEAAAK